MKAAFFCSRFKLARAIEILKREPRTSGAEIGRLLGLGRHQGARYRMAALAQLPRPAPAPTARPAPVTIAVQPYEPARAMQGTHVVDAHAYVIPVLRDMM